MRGISAMWKFKLEKIIISILPRPLRYKYITKKHLECLREQEAIKVKELEGMAFRQTLLHAIQSLGGTDQQEEREQLEQMILQKEKELSDLRYDIRLVQVEKNEKIEWFL